MPALGAALPQRGDALCDSLAWIKFMRVFFEQTVAARTPGRIIERPAEKPAPLKG
jgi:hypothetical protein